MLSSVTLFNDLGMLEIVNISHSFKQIKHSFTIDDINIFEIEQILIYQLPAKTL